MSRIATFLSLGSPAVTELISPHFSVAIVDAEHGPGLDGEIEHMLRAMSPRCTPWIRVFEPAQIGRALDLGAQGVLVPRIRSLSDVDSSISAFEFPPQGQRGWGPGRAARYGSLMSDLLARASQNELWLQIETLDALNCLPAIAERSGFHGLFVGPGDLSLAMGIPGEWNNPSLQETIQEIYQASVENNKKFAIFGLTTDTVQQWPYSVADLLVIGSDASWLLNGLEGYRHWIEERRP